MRYLIYEQLTSNSKLADVRLTEREAIEAQKLSAWQRNGYIYENDILAVKEFIELHRAWWRDEL